MNDPIDLRVWVLETGAYENRFVEGIYTTAEAAMAAYPNKPWIHDDERDTWRYSTEESMDDCAYLYEMRVMQGEGR